jgi:hypothetical protein
MERQHKRGRADSFYPYLLVRSVMGDRGDRPFNVPFWESPDIWTAAGDPATTPAVPADHGGTLTVGQPQTLYAHVWNLGFAPLAGILVEFYWFNPSLSIDGTNANLIGHGRCELAGRGMGTSHALVKCTTAWVPVLANGGHECLVVRVSGIGDPIGANEWQPWQNRHVAQRNVSVVPAQANTTTLIASLEETRLPTGRLQLVQLGAREGVFAAKMVAPGKTISPKVVTHSLGALDAKKGIVADRPKRPTPGMLAPFHELTEGGPPPTAPIKKPGQAPVIDPRLVLADVPVAPTELRAATGVGDLLASVGVLHAGSGVVAKPSAKQVHVLRLANYDEKGQLVGGYTMILPGA